MHGRLVLLLISLAFSCCAQTYKECALKLLSVLDDDQKAKIQYSYQDQERFNWNFVPTGRHGISFHDFTPAQKDAALKFLSASLSEQGFEKASGIFALEKILRGVEGRPDDDKYRDPKNYFFTIFGDPSSDKIWGWRIEGHHLSLNFSSTEGLISSSTPSFFGANPAIVPSGPDKGKKTLQDEMDLGFQLVNQLDADQLKVARFSETALPEIVTGNKRKAELLEPRGIAYKNLTKGQQQTFLKLLNVYVKNYEFGFSQKLMAKINKAGIDNLTFAWAGSLTPGGGHYYRIQGPMLIIEYDNTQTSANHIHTTVRDLTNDFAEDILREHYERDHR